MMSKKKPNAGRHRGSNGRVLPAGEYEMPNQTYKYRFTDLSKKRCRVYAKTLEELWDKEAEIAGMDGKSLQYLAGHSDTWVAMNVYAHSSYEKAEESMEKLLHLGKAQPPSAESIRGKKLNFRPFPLAISLATNGRNLMCKGVELSRLTTWGTKKSEPLGAGKCL